MEETNADWWTGKVNGRRGLFPSNYVEKISSSDPEKANPAATMHSVPPRQSEKKAYKPFMAARHGIDTPPPPGQGANSLGLQQASGQEAKASKYGAYKNTVLVQLLSVFLDVSDRMTWHCTSDGSFSCCWCWCWCRYGHRWRAGSGYILETEALEPRRGRTCV